MRVITGSCKGRRLVTPEGLTTRPTSDMLKGVLFNTISWRVEVPAVIDLCAGSGALGIEALSRGAGYATFFESDRLAIESLKDNIEHCNLKEKSMIIPGDLLKTLPVWQPHIAPGLIFFDPPYLSDLYEPIMQMISQAKWLNSETLVIVEHHEKVILQANYGRLNLWKLKNYGKVKLSFYISSQ